MVDEEEKRSKKVCRKGEEKREDKRGSGENKEIWVIKRTGAWQGQGLRA